MTDRKPTVSVVIATYNRSNVLAYALRSLVRSRFADWEAIVVGDACTDDTAEVVASIGDPRITFVNLAHNVGEQSGPNNEGFRRASGRYIAYLNHDDLWFPDHLERAVAALAESDADLVYAMPAFHVRGGALRVLPIVEPDRRFRGDMQIPASCWVLRRELVEALGGWRPARECHDAPSQDFLARAFAAGKDLRANPVLTVVQIISVTRKGAYATRAVEEQAAHFDRMTGDPRYREQLLTEMLLEQIGRTRRANVRYHASRIVVTLGKRLALRLGVSPRVLARVLLLRRRGSVIDDLRRERGLPALARRRGTT